MHIGRVVKTIRVSRGLSQSLLAQRMGISQSLLSYLENGQVGWSDKTIRLAARAVGLRPFMLLMNDRERLRAKSIFA